MLTSSRRHISDYSSAAADVRLQVATTRTVGQPRPVTAVERQGIERIRNLVKLGSRFGHDSDGNLTGSTPEQTDLVGELKRLIPARIGIIKDSDGGLDLKSWSDLAQSVLDDCEAEAIWESYSTEHKEFVEFEFEPFLVKLLKVDPEDEEE